MRMNRPVVSWFRVFSVSWSRVCVVSYAFVVSCLAVAAQAAAQSPTRPHVETLASSKLEGRLAGSNGEKLATGSMGWWFVTGNAWQESDVRSKGLRPDLPSATPW